MNTGSVRVRFAPSPTGPLHLGGVRTALYNYLFARKYQGKFILRIEDTDQNRLVPGAEQYILDSLKWCGISPDEGDLCGGPFMPYRQSDRKDIYRSYIQQLIDTGHAYYAFDTPEELENQRKTFQITGSDLFQYDSRTRNHLKNSLVFSTQEVSSRLRRGEPYVVRILIPENEMVSFQDLIRGTVSVSSYHLDDKVLFKSDGWPTYHLANVVDDYLMKISHVIRGEEWLPSAPLHILLYRFFEWEDSMPQFAHLPLILKPDGAGKLSKRDGDKLGFPVFPLAWKDPFSGDSSRGYREDGYLSPAFINMLALLGWNPGTEQELFSLDELVSHFSLERIHKSGSRFDPDKAKWFNRHYLVQLPDSVLADYLIRLAAGGWRSGSFSSLLFANPPVHDLSDLTYAMKVVPLIRERITLIPELWSNAWFFYYSPESHDPLFKEKVWKPETKQALQSFLKEVRQLDQWKAPSIHDLVQRFTSRTGIKTGQLLSPLRLLLVGSNQGPGILEISEVIGKEDFLSRIEAGL